MTAAGERAGKARKLAALRAMASQDESPMERDIARAKLRQSDWPYASLAEAIAATPANGRLEVPGWNGWATNV